VLVLKDWNPVTKEMALTGGNEMITYAASKKFAEIALWDWADKHPHVEVTTRTFFLVLKSIDPTNTMTLSK
jgi:nucleoside-diphosphate-sugar epimerase